MHGYTPNTSHCVGQACVELSCFCVRRDYFSSEARIVKIMRISYECLKISVHRRKYTIKYVEFIANKRVIDNYYFFSRSLTHIPN